VNKSHCRWQISPDRSGILFAERSEAKRYSGWQAARLQVVICSASKKYDDTCYIF